jgi:hypothetical protein|tara:strand:- start:7 stop:177 length:171 start_codon:yes stop_codon:yes gene_type:complete
MIKKSGHKLVSIGFGDPRSVEVGRLVAKKQAILSHFSMNKFYYWIKKGIKLSNPKK